MEIVVVTGVLAVAALTLLSLRARRSRGSVRRPGGTRQWSGSAGRSRAARAERPTAVPAAASSGAVAYASMPAGGVAVQDPPQTREADLDDWDDDLGWEDGLDARDEPAPPAPVTFRPPPADPEPAAPVAEPPRDPAPAAPYSLQAAPAPVEEPAWDDDLAGEPAPAGGSGRPFPSARGAAAFGASQATPPARKPRRGAALRSPAVMVTVYAVAGIALVVLAVSLLAGGLSPSPSKEAKRTAQATKPAPAPSPASTGPTAAERAAAAAAEQRAFERGQRAARAEQARATRLARERRAKRLAERRLERRRLERRRARRQAAQNSAAAPARPAPPIYVPPTPAPSTGGSSGGSSGGGSSSGGGGSGCEFCIG
jgi:hypothetical protein